MYRYYNIYLNSSQNEKYLEPTLYRISKHTFYFQ